MKLLLLNQTFHPDVASTAQHLSDLALRLVERGHQVTVISSRRAYDHPEKQFPKRETWRGIEIYRVASTSFGKGAKWRRAADFASFICSCSLRLITLSRHDAVVALTSPPLISFIGAVIARWWKCRFYYWVMDLNPDEAIAAGWLRPDSLIARVLDWMSRYSLRHATRIIALDRFMADRIAAKLKMEDGRSKVEAKAERQNISTEANEANEADRINPQSSILNPQRSAPRPPSSTPSPPSTINSPTIIQLPPWSHDDEVRFDAEGRQRFRKAHELEGKFVVMYSGNHSPCHPLDTLLEAAEKLKFGKQKAEIGNQKSQIENRKSKIAEIVFCFVGGGSEWGRIQKMEDGRWKMEGETESEKAESRNLELGARNPEPETPLVARCQPTVASRQPMVTTSQPLAADGRQPLPDSSQPSVVSSHVPISSQLSGIGEQQRLSSLIPHPSSLPPSAVSSQSSVVSGQPPPSSILHPPSSNLLCLPYQPLDQLSASLSAADLHVVVMGEPFVGIVHPCKIYNILAVGAPILYIGPSPSHVTEMFEDGRSTMEAGVEDRRLKREDREWGSASRLPSAPSGAERPACLRAVVGQSVPPASPPHLPSPISHLPAAPSSTYGHAAHGDVEAVVAHIQHVRGLGDKIDRGQWTALAGKFSKENLLPQLIAVLEG